MAVDRATGCGADYVFERIDPEPIGLGNTPGLVFGFARTMPNGNSSEYNLQYATIVGDTIITMVAAAYDDGGCPGRDELSGFRSDDLIELRPHLEHALYESPLPTMELDVNMIGCLAFLALDQRGPNRIHLSEVDHAAPSEKALPTITKQQLRPPLNNPTGTR